MKLSDGTMDIAAQPDTTLERTLEFASKLVVITVIMRTWRWCRQERDRETRDITSRDIERY